MEQEHRMEKEDLKIVNKGLEDEMVSSLPTHLNPRDVHYRCQCQGETVHK